MSTTILSIESSCDETAAAIVVDGREVKSNIIYSQIELHKLYGGVVPEIASRKHVEKVNQVIRAAIEEAHVTWDDIDAVAVTYGPGLVGALLVGVSAAKAVAYAKKKPLVGVHHIEGHIAANYIEHPDLEPPFMCMVASGGHSHLVYVKDYTTFEIVGRTRDDAAGEAFDKVARAIGLGYPGGPKIDKLAKEGNKEAIHFPRAFMEDAPYDFSFSGLKSAVLNYLNGWNRSDGFDEAVWFTPASGPRAMHNSPLGRDRLVLSAETVIFTPWQPLGFRIALYGFGDVGFLGYNKHVFRNDCFATVGLGIRLKNEMLVFGTIQLSLFVNFGKHGLMSNEWIQLTSEQRMQTMRYIPTKPQVAPFQ